MKKFKLVCADGETMSIIQCEDIHEAVIRFSRMKQMSVRDLLKIFYVESI
jgi:hypothetical protein